MLGPGGLGMPSGMMPPQENWRPPEHSDGAVQVTHVDAALAKVSCAQLGYFEDRWTELLIRNTRPQPRSPMIHRGYYSRVAAIRSSVLRFLELCPPGGGVQIVNLGVGFDTTYFWLREDPVRWRDDIVYFEVDFPEVLSKKVSALLKRRSLWPLLGGDSQEELISSEMSAAGTRVVRTQHCRHVPADMRIAPELADAMASAGFRGDVPTLFISECVLVYMQSLHGDGIIDWAANAVPDAPSAMVVYEQTNPNDPFGKVMVDNLTQRGCPLLSIFDYPSLASQRERYLQRGWERCNLANMNEVYEKHLDRAEVERIQRLELLDEFEEWHLIQQHYFLLIATRAPGAATPAAEDASGVDGAANAAVGVESGGGTGAAVGPGGGIHDWVHGLALSPAALVGGAIAGGPRATIEGDGH
mmetsp:Transcript_55136/g.118387  ORF Transcript_55136/g.118387 Transcript_55136/m.118387 type:complete len:414 (+) Transcript_55136:73-1314(+)